MSTATASLSLCGLVVDAPVAEVDANYAAARKCRLCGTQSVLALTKHTPGRKKDRRSQIYHQIRYHIQKVSSAYLQLEISMVFGVPLRTERICLIYRYIWLKSCLNIVGYRLGKYQGMPWSVGASVLPCVRLHLQVWRGESTRVEALDRILIRITPSRMGGKTALCILLVLCTPICKRLFRRIRHTVLAGVAKAQTRTESGQPSRDATRRGLRK